jgi:hypothetical protein
LDAPVDDVSSIINWVQGGHIALIRNEHAAFAQTGSGAGILRTLTAVLALHAVGVRRFP